MAAGNIERAPYVEWKHRSAETKCKAWKGGGQAGNGGSQYKEAEIG